MANELYGPIADTEQNDPTYHIADERGRNEPFHPVSNCGKTLRRELTEDVPDGSEVCKSCSPTKSDTSSKKPDPDA